MKGRHLALGLGLGGFLWYLLRQAHVGDRYQILEIRRWEDGWIATEPRTYETLALLAKNLDVPVEMYEADMLRGTARIVLLVPPVQVNDRPVVAVFSRAGSGWRIQGTFLGRSSMGEGSLSLLDAASPVYDKIRDVKALLG